MIFYGLKKNISVKDKLKSAKIVGLNPWRTSQVYFLRHICSSFNTKKFFVGASFEDGLKTQKVLRDIIISSKNRNYYID